MKELNDHLKSGKLDKVYVFYGPEVYLINAYEKRLRAASGALDINIAAFEGEGLVAANVIEAAETVPFFGAHRLIILKNTGLLQTGKKAASDQLADYLPGAPDSAVFVFIETKKPPDKRGRLYKAAAAGFAAEFVTPKENELAAWLTKLLASEGVTVNMPTAREMLRHIGEISSGGVMENLHSEARKLAAYKNYGGQADIADVRAVCAGAVEGKIFALLKQISGRELGAAQTSLAALLASGEAPLGIMAMIARQFRLMLICKGLRDAGQSAAEIAKTAALRDFMVRDFLKQGNNFGETAMAGALARILDAECRIKTGKSADKTALEMLLIGLCL